MLGTRPLLSVSVMLPYGAVSVTGFLHASIAAKLSIGLQIVLAALLLARRLQIVLAALLLAKIAADPCSCFARASLRATRADVFVRFDHGARSV